MKEVHSSSTVSGSECPRLLPRAAVDPVLMSAYSLVTCGFEKCCYCSFPLGYACLSASVCTAIDSMELEAERRDAHIQSAIVFLIKPRKIFFFGYNLKNYQPFPLV